MDYTENLNLVKPAKAEQYNIETWNANSDIIDAAFKDEVDTRLDEDTKLQRQIDENRNEERRIGTVPIEKGGTGATTAQDALNALHGSVETQSDISADDEVTFIRRTPANIETETPESIDIKDVKFESLANRVYEIMRARGSSLFSATENGLVPKSGSAGSAAFLSATGAWENPSFAESTIDVANSRTVAITDNTVMRITATSSVTVVLEDGDKLGRKLTVYNGTDLEHTLSCKSVAANANISIKARCWFSLYWNGSAWQAESEQRDYQKSVPVTAVADGGTGKTTHTANSVLLGNGTSAIQNKATASGAFYATSANGAPTFGTLPVAQGGTGATDAAGARTNLGITAKFVFDIVHPVGTVYVQYPQQSSPNDLWGSISTWKVLDYSGAFFRAQGGNANAFIEKTGVLTAQAEGLPNITGKFHASNINGVSGAFYESGNTDGTYDSDGSFSSFINLAASRSSPIYGASSHVTPMNYTIKIWKRTA